MSSMRIGMVQCEHCGRQFNPHSAARHIPWCAKQQSENKKHRLSNEKKQALERYKWRINYRPSNQIRTATTTQPLTSRRPTTLSTSDNNNYGQHGRLFKNSSVNSSATLSSPSASSSASIGGTSIGSNSLSKNYSNNNQQRTYRTQPSKASQLKRSVSSVTLTKQSGGANALRKNLTTRDLPQSQQPVHKRTKSVSNLDDMGEIVETLAKRVDEIYAQNQLLLATISMGNLSVNQVKGRELASEDGASDSDTGEKQRVECHHCKSSCMDGANYCHQCGCKVRSQLMSENSSPG